MPRVHDVRFGRRRPCLSDRHGLRTWQDTRGGLGGYDSPIKKLSVAQELHGYVCQLRRLKGDYIGAVDHGKAIIGKQAPLEGGPFSWETLSGRLPIYYGIMQNMPLRITIRLFSPMAIWFPGIYGSMKNAVSRLSSIGNMLAGIQSTGNISGHCGS